MRVEPWWAEGAVKELEQRLAGCELKVFEWGSGGSTLWLAERCGIVISVEHDGAWWRKVSEHLQSDVAVALLQRPLGESYWNAIEPFMPDLVVIDGRHRKRCAELALRKLPEMILWDDVQRDWYQCVADVLKKCYRHVDFADAIAPPRVTRLYTRLSL